MGKAITSVGPDSSMYWDVQALHLLDVLER
jgi:hypothetical protein